MYPIYPYFKLVFKFAQIGMTLKSKQSLQRKQERAMKEMDDITIQIQSDQSLIENLDFGNNYSAEAARARNSEIARLRSKQNQLRNKIAEMQQYTNDTWIQAYLNDLWGGVSWPLVCFLLVITNIFSRAQLRRKKPWWWWILCLMVTSTDWW